MNAVINPKIDKAKADADIIIRRIIALDDEYVLDEKYIRWGKVQKDIHAIIESLDNFTFYGCADVEEYYREEHEDDCEDDPRRNGAVELLNDCDIASGCYFEESGKCLLEKCEDREPTE